MIHVPKKNFVSPIINAYRNDFAKLLNVGQQIIPVKIAGNLTLMAWLGW